MKNILLQNVSTYETRTVKQAVLLLEKNEYDLISCDINSIEKYKDIDFVPVGSVEFCKKAMMIKGIEVPWVNPYPIKWYDFLKRRVDLMTLGEFFSYVKVVDQAFIKPFELKKFNGFVYYSNKSITEYDEHDIEQLRIIFSMKMEEFVWVSNVVNIEYEFRYYVQGNGILGYARYDDKEIENVPEPKPEFVKTYIEKVNKIYNWKNKCYCIDIGILDNDQECVVEYNDAWAIGLYKDALTPKQYLNFLVSGWNYIIGD